MFFRARTEKIARLVVSTAFDHKNSVLFLAGAICQDWLGATLISLNHIHVYDIIVTFWSKDVPINISKRIL